ncbi:MAG: helix-turn-helix domain-containing protein [Actinobacteria bacterium]|nr:helix-turn-helix domain-containing protein [Actinomycetota bacterium]
MTASTHELSSTPLGELPPVLTVEEAAKVLRIGRGAAYELARRYRATEGREGLPVVSFGRTLRVPRAALLRLLGHDEVIGDGERRAWLG